MDSRLRLLQRAIAIVLGLAGAVGIWLVAPYNNLIIRNASISDSYLPPIVLLLTMALVLGVNPVLRLLRLPPLSARQLALAVGLMLMACVLPTTGSTGGLIVTLARTPNVVQRDAVLSQQYESLQLPASLFPDSPRPGAPTTVGDGYMSGLQPGEPIPWSAWTGPLVAWGGFLLFAWMMMVGLSMIMLPQWRNNERLAFPLLAIQQSLIETPGPGQVLPPLLRARSFWIAVAGVMLIYAFYGLAQYWPDTVPQIPVNWDFNTLFATEPWRDMPGYMRSGRIYFLLIGMAFFMPTRISFSIWFFLIVYGLYRGFAPGFGWTHYIEKTDDQRYGAVITLTICVLWIGRAQWAAVIRSMFGRGGSAVDSRNRVSGWVFTVGIVGMFAWLMWAGWAHIRSAEVFASALARHAAWSAVLVAFAFMISLLISRIVAETGMPFVRLYEQPLVLMQMTPVAWVGAVSLFMAVMMELMVSLASRVSPATMSMHVIGLDESGPPQRQSRLGLALIGLLVLGLVVTGASNLAASYGNSTTWNNLPVHGEVQNHLADAHSSLKEMARRPDDSGPLNEMPYSRYLHFGIGAGLAGTLYYLCLAIPQWPIHPFGLMLVDSHYGHNSWSSIFVGWLLQIAIVKYGGARLYRRARPVFLGLIIGEVLAGAVWALAPVLLTALDFNYIPVIILPQ